MRNYYYQSRIIIELYCEGSKSRCEIVTLHYDGSTDSHKMWLTKKMFEEAMDGDQDARRGIDVAYTYLVNSGII